MTISSGSAVLTQVTAECPYTLLWAPLKNPQNCPFHGGKGTPLNITPWVHSSPQSKQHLDRFCRFCTDDRSVSLYFTMGRPFPLKITPSHGGSGRVMLNGNWLTSYRFTSLETGSQSEKPVIRKFLSLYYALRPIY